MDNPLHFIRANSITDLPAVSLDHCQPAAALNRLWLGLRRLLTSLAEHIWSRPRDPVRNQRLAQKILDSAPNYLALLDLTHDRVLYVNASWAAFFGCPQPSVTRLNPVIHPADQPVYQHFLSQLKSGQGSQPCTAEFRTSNARGEWRWLACQGQVFQHSKPRQVLLSAADVTENHRIREHLRHISTHDTLTGLYNRAYFQEALEAVRQAGQFPTALIMIDVDNLKLVNDTYGHEIGDAFLCEIAGLLLDNFRAGDTIARVGGDEFTALLPQVNQADAREIVRRLQARFAGAVSATGLSLDVVSVGLSVARDETEFLDAYRQADRRMYADKKRRKATSKRWHCSGNSNKSRYSSVPIKD